MSSAILLQALSGEHHTYNSIRFVEVSKRIWNVPYEVNKLVLLPITNRIVNTSLLFRYENQSWTNLFGKHTNLQAF